MNSSNFNKIEPYVFIRCSLKAFKMTETELKDMAVLQSMGLTAQILRSECLEKCSQTTASIAIFYWVYVNS